MVVKHIKNLLKKWTFASIKERIIKAFHDNNSVLGECARINTRRIYYLSIIAIPLRVFNILLFTSRSYDTEVLKTWSQGIIASHSILLIFMIGFFITTHKLKNRTVPNTAMFLLQYIVVVVIMASGITIVTIDQLVTTNITPLLIICIVTGVIFFIRPSQIAVAFSVSFSCFRAIL